MVQSVVSADAAIQREYKFTLVTTVKLKAVVTVCTLIQIAIMLLVKIV